MGVNLSGRSFLRLLDFTTEEIEYMLKLSRNFKDLKRTGTPHRYLEGKNIVLLFQKTSTRTRCAFEVGAMDLGMGVTYLDPGSSQMGKKESIEDTARVLGRMYDGIEFRGFAQEDVEELAAKSGVPVWNGLTDLWHPTQMLADILTVQENFNYDIKGKTLVFMGDAKNNVARSLMVVCAKLGMNFVACGPEECMPASDVIEACKPIAEANGCTITLTTDPKAACTGAHDDEVGVICLVGPGRQCKCSGGEHGGHLDLEGHELFSFWVGASRELDCYPIEARFSKGGIVVYENCSNGFDGVYSLVGSVCRKGSFEPASSWRFSECRHKLL